jgi:UDP-N-acetyl-D-mannosaminuronic acid dehydrogenase
VLRTIGSPSPLAGSTTSCRTPTSPDGSAPVHDPWVDPATSPDAPPGLSRDFAGVLSGADAVVVFCRGLVPEPVKRLGGAYPAFVEGRSVVDPNAEISVRFVYRGIVRGDKNQ